MVLKGDAFGGIMLLEEQADKVPLLPDALLWVAKRSHIREVAQATGTGFATRSDQDRPGENGRAFLDECEAHIDPLGTDWKFSSLDASEQFAKL